MERGISRLGLFVTEPRERRSEAKTAAFESEEGWCEDGGGGRRFDD